MKDSRRTSIFWLGNILLAGLFVAFGIYAATQRSEAPPDADGEDPQLARNRRVIVGGIERPQSDVQRRDRKNQNSVEAPPQRFPYGRTPQIPADESPIVASVYDAVTNRTNPERISAFLPAKPFSLESYRKDPAAYLDSYEPGRVWQTAQPGPDTPVLTPLVPSSQQLAQGESVRLRVRTAPDYPVTFVALDLGAFSNRLPAITVAADDTGLAEAVFTATPGTINIARVIVASPGATEQASFRLSVRLPSD